MGAGDGPPRRGPALRLRGDSLNRESPQIQRRSPRYPLQQDPPPRVATECLQRSVDNQGEGLRIRVKDSGSLPPPVVLRTKADGPGFFQRQANKPPRGEVRRRLSSRGLAELAAKDLDLPCIHLINEDNPVMQLDISLRTRMRTSETHETAWLDTHALEIANALPEGDRGLNTRTKGERDDDDLTRCQLVYPMG